MVSKRKVYTAVFLTVFGLCLFGFIWSWIVTKDIRTNTVSDEIKSRKVVVKNLVLTETKDESVYWELYAQSGTYESSTGHVVLDHAMGNFYNAENKVVLSIESDQGTYEENEKIITLEGNALVVSHDGSSIKADKIIWKGREEDIVAEGHVLVRRNDDFLATSKKAVFNYDFTKFKIEGDCKTLVYNPGNSGDSPKQSFNLNLGAK